MLTANRENVEKKVALHEAGKNWKQAFREMHLKRSRIDNFKMYINKLENGNSRQSETLNSINVQCTDGQEPEAAIEALPLRHSGFFLNKSMNRLSPQAIIAQYHQRIANLHQEVKNR